MKKRLWWVAAAAALAIGGCAGETGLPEATGEGTVRAINAIETAPAIAFLVEERSLGTVEFKNATAPDDWDDLDYTFNFEVVLAGASERTRVASQYIDVVADTEYTLLISGDLAAPDITVWEAPEPEFAEGATQFEGRFGHIAPSLGPLDVYFTAPGVAPAAGQAVGSLTFGEQLSPQLFEDGDYVLTLTTSGDAADVVFESDTLSPGPGNSFLFTVFDPDANDLAPASVRLFNSAGTSGTITDINYPPRLQFIHATTAAGNADIYIEDNGDMLTTPDVSDHTFRDITAELPALAGENFITYTTPPNTSAVLYATSIGLAAGTRNRFILTGDVDNIQGTGSAIIRRPIETVGQLVFYYTSLNHPLVDIYLVERDATIDEAAPLYFGVGPSGGARRTQLIAGNFDLYVATADVDRTIIAGPYALDMGLGDIVELIVFDIVGDPTTVEFVSIP